MSGLHVGIAGAGLAGRMLAWRLLRRGCRVTLLDARARGSQDTASAVAAAMLSPLAELAVSDTVVFGLGQRSMVLWPQWIAELHADNPQVPQVYYRQQGSLVVAHAPDQTALAHFTRLLQHKLPPAYLPQVQHLDAPAVVALEPALAGRFAHGLHLQGEGQVANDQWMAALARELDRLGAQWHEGVEVLALEPRCLHGRRSATEGQEPGAALRWDVDCVVDARGVGSKALLGALRGVRGEVLRVHCRGVTLQRPVRLMHPRYQLYVVPRPDDVFVVGATELESEDTGPVTLRSMLELGSALYSLHPAFGEARVHSLHSALRPALDNDQPACLLQDGVWHINGLYRHGYLCAPALVETLTHHLLETAP